jgi:hypothetical protein
VERTKPFIGASCLLQSHDSANDIYDVTPAFYLVYVIKIIRSAIDSHIYPL